MSGREEISSPKNLSKKTALALCHAEARPDRVSASVTRKGLNCHSGFLWRRQCYTPPTSMALETVGEMQVLVPGMIALTPTGLRNSAKVEPPGRDGKTIASRRQSHSPLWLV